MIEQYTGVFWRACRPLSSGVRSDDSGEFWQWLRWIADHDIIVVREGWV